MKIGRRLAPADNLLILRTPFQAVEVRQLVYALSAKWILRREVLGKVERLEHDLDTESAARVRVEAELDATQRIGFIGQLAASVARQVRMPLEERGEAIRFVRLAWEDVGHVLRHYRTLLLETAATSGDAKILSQMKRIDQLVDLTGIEAGIPEAFRKIVDGDIAITALVEEVQVLAGGGDPEPQDEVRPVPRETPRSSIQR
jgi:hypothetical protein